MDIDDAIEKLETTSKKLGQIKFNNDSPDQQQQYVSIREATLVEQNLLNLWDGEPNITLELQNAIAYCNNNRNDISCLLHLADVNDKIGVFPYLRSETERMLNTLEEKTFELKYLRTQYEAGWNSLDDPDSAKKSSRKKKRLDSSDDPSSAMKKSRKIKQLQELEKTIKQYEAHMVKLNKQISQLDDKIQEKSNILDDLGHIFLAEEEEQHVALENVTNMLESEIEETKRNIREYVEEEEHARQAIPSHTETSSISPPPTEQTQLNTTFIQLENSLDELLSTDDPEANHDYVVTLTNELNTIALLLEEQVKDTTDLPDQTQEYADRLSMLMKKMVNYISKHSHEQQQNDQLEQLRQHIPMADYSLSTQKLKASILAEIQECDVALPDLKGKLKGLGYKEMEIVTAIYKLNTSGFILVDRDQPVTMVRCIYPFGP